MPRAMPDDTVGRRIRDLRVRFGLTLEELAERSHITFQYLQKLEKDRANPSLEVLMKIANGLSVKTAALIPEEPRIKDGLEIWFRGNKLTPDQQREVEHFMMYIVEKDKRDRSRASKNKGDPET